MGNNLVSRCDIHVVQIMFTQSHPWDWYIYLPEWLIFMVNVGNYISPMDAMGKSYEFHFGHFVAVHRYYME